MRHGDLMQMYHEFLLLTIKKSSSHWVYVIS